MDLLKKSFHGIDCVFHLAVIASVKKSIDYPLRTNEVGIVGTQKVLLAARAGVRRVVLASSAAVYGNSPQLPKREDMTPECSLGLLDLYDPTDSEKIIYCYNKGQVKWHLTTADNAGRVSIYGS
jgi:nucleoside-diphosphate-sugar epimerase